MSRKKSGLDQKQIEQVRRFDTLRVDRRQPALPDREEMISNFVAAVSHELKTPLAIIKESILQLQEGLLGPVNEKQVRSLNLSLNSVNRLIRLVEELLDASRLEKGKFNIHKKNLNILELVFEVFRNFVEIVKKEGKILQYELETQNRHLLVYADKDKITQVIINLLQNALKHTRVGDSLKIKIRPKEGRVYISIADTGAGMPADQLNHIFEKFYQIEEDGQDSSGLGLGLSISSEIVKLHGGDLQVKSQLGQGTEFTLKLPQTIKFLPQIIKLIYREGLDTAEMQQIRDWGVLKFLLEAIAYPGLGLDEKEELLESLAEMNIFRGVLPALGQELKPDKKRLA